MANSEKQISTRQQEAIQSFLSKVRVAVEKLRHIEPRRVWYRGLSRREYTLLPSLLRRGLVGEDLRLREKNLFARFQTQAGELLPHGLGSSWEILSVMQHYGVPTRMMDWTDALFVALYFALHYEDKDKVCFPCIWLLNPFALNRRALSLDNAIIFDQVDRLPENAYKAFIEKKDASKCGAWPPTLPVATAPIWGHPRALRQHGFFTIHGTDSKPLEEQAKDLVEKIEIPDELHDPLRQLLEEAGLDHYSLFPDLEGLARKLRWWYRWT
jgi:hypothetical protein